MWQSITDAVSLTGLPTAMILAKATVMLLLALGLTLAMQRMSAMSRHLVWLVSVAALLLIPAVAMWSPVRFAILPGEWAPQSASPAARAMRVATAATSTLRDAPVAVVDVPRGAPVAASASMQLDAVGTSGERAGPASAKPAASAPLDMARTIALIWASVAAALLLWLAYGALTVRRIISGATPLADGAWNGALVDIADRLGLDVAPRLLRSTTVAMPFACGLRTSTIVLPVECDSWSPDRRTAVLLHELGHIRRRDLVGHTLGRVACALYWFHPLVWTAARRLRAESERACDDLALNCGTRPSDYAEHLLDIVTSVRKHGTPSVAMAMATRSEFEGRMLAILDPTLPRVAPTGRQMSAMTGGVLLCAMVIGCVVPKSTLPERERQDSRDAVASQVMTPSVDRDADADASGLRDGSDLRGASGLSGAMFSGDSLVRDESRRDAMLRVEAAARPQAPERPERPEPQATERPVDAGAVWQDRPQWNGTPERSLRIARDSGNRATALARVLRTDSSAKLRRVAAWGLSETIDDDVAVAALVVAVRRDANASVREMAAWALAYAPDEPRVSEALIDAIRNDSDGSVRGSALWALSEMSQRESPATVAALIGVLSDANDDARLRETAAWGLGQMSPRRAPAALLGALRDGDARVRATVAWALLQIEDENAAASLDAALSRETDADAKRAMVRALGAMGDKSVDAMQRLIDSPDQELRALAIRALARHGADPWPQPRPRPRPFP